MNQKIRLLLLIVGILTTFAVHSQNFLGFQSSNYAGTYSLYSQPANVADNRLGFDINLMGLSNTISNNFMSYNGQRFFTTGLSKDLVSANGSYDLKNQDLYFFRDTRTDKKYSAYINTDLYGPLSFMAQLSRKVGIAFTWKNRTIANIQDVDGTFANLVYKELKDSMYQKQDINISGMKIAAANYNEYGFTYGQVLMDKGKHFLKGGATIKLMQGFVAGSLFVNQAIFNMNNDTLFDVKDANVDYATTANVTTIDPADALSITQNNNAFPAGWGADIGLVYEYRPKIANYEYIDKYGKTQLKREENKYKLKVGLSLLDIGHVTYRQSRYSGNAKGTSLDLSTTTFTASSIPGYDNLISSKFNTVHGVSSEKMKMSLPTALSLQVDYNIYKKLYVNVMPFFAFQKTLDGKALAAISNFSVTPRWEGRLFGLAIPFSVNNYGSTMLGFGVRTPTIPLVPVHIMIGSNNLLSSFYSKKTQSTDFHVALHIPIAYRKNKDKDFDGVKDKKDKCPEVAGLKTFDGCPDTDEDGIQDSEDKCPEVAGLEMFDGCPDKDNDGIQDSEDACPDVAGQKKFDGCPDTDRDGIADNKDDCKEVYGLEKFQGCPDKDGDDIADKDDTCPDVKGLPAFKGCPDRDADGIQDSEDTCPDVKGVTKFQGCPDTDNDGIQDSEDLCPKEPGTKELKGCAPETPRDTDGDGIFDNDDDCPFEPGVPKLKGCPLPDGDKDGIADEKDKCPNEPGVIENEGCPKVTPISTPSPTPVVVAEVVRKAFENLEFETAKAVILPKSFANMDDLATYLIANPKLKLFIAGHTDNVGDPNGNMKLSANRAAAAKAYLVSKGVSEIRLTTAGYGETQPLNDNKTPENRQRNRRVEVVVFE